VTPDVTEARQDVTRCQRGTTGCHQMSLRHDRMSPDVTVDSNIIRAQKDDTRHHNTDTYKDTLYVRSDQHERIKVENLRERSRTRTS
jgi:hypothetical protein